MKRDLVVFALAFAFFLLFAAIMKLAAAEERLFQINNCPEESIRYCRIFTYAEKQDGEWRAVRTGLVASECEFFRDTNSLPSEQKECYRGDGFLQALQAREAMVIVQPTPGSLAIPWPQNPGRTMWATASTYEGWEERGDW